jgi:heme/copper-type cytochrome/quinol oxidase subunit 2
MLIIIIPVIFLTLFFAWRYRQSNTSAKYDPEWDHSTKLELIIWEPSVNYHRFGNVDMDFYTYS